MVKITGGPTDNRARVDPNGYLMVCVCEGCTVPKLEELLKAGWVMQLFVEDESGEIVPLKQPLI